MAVIPAWLVKVVLYGGAPFFASPHKIVVNYLAGIDYRRTYSHFRRDHQDPSNLAYHLVCLVFQLGFNFQLLAEVDRMLGMRGQLSKLTAVMWAAVNLAATECPLSVRTATTAAIALAYNKAGPTLSGNWRSMAMVTGVLEMLAVQVFVINKAKDSSGEGRIPMDKAQLAKLIAGRWLLQALVTGVTRGGARVLPAAATTAVNLALAAWMARVSQDPFKPPERGGGTFSSPFSLGFFGWLLAFATDQPWLYFYSGGFLASAAQGVAHHYAGEQGTLPQLSDPAAELSHTTWFPNILLQSVLQSVKSGRGPAP